MSIEPSALPNLKQILAIFDPQLPLEKALTPPASWYARNDVLALEREAVFAHTWQWVCTRDRLTHPGDYLTGQFFDWPYIVLVGPNGQLHAFFNICRHHGTCVAKGDGHTKTLVCPYHGWTYDLSGKLIKAPKAGASHFLRDKGIGLIPIPLITAGRFIGLRFSPTPVEIHHPHQTEIEALDDAEFRFVARQTYEMDCNWKVFIDNYLDGGYHVPCMHPDLASDLDLKHYRTEILERAAMQTCAPKDAREKTGKNQRVSSQARYLWIYPNFCLNQYGHWLDTNVVIPTGPKTCQVVFDYFYQGELSVKDRDSALEGSAQVQREDMAICDMVQAGINSGIYHQGIYAPKFEASMYQFHRWLSTDLKAGLAKYKTSE